MGGRAVVREMLGSNGPTSNGPHSPIHRTSPIAHSHMLSFACSRCVRISEWHAARRFVFLLNGAFSAAMASVCMCAAMARSPTCHVPKPGNLTFLSRHYQPFPARPSHCPNSCEHACIFCVAERQSHKCSFASPSGGTWRRPTDLEPPRDPTGCSVRWP